MVNQEILNAISPDKLIAAYIRGMFPMVEDDRLMWFQPSPRGVLPLDDEFHVSRSLARTIRRGRFKCTIDKCFEETMRLCGDRSDGSETWISPEIQITYGQLHMLGYAHSVETWLSDDENMSTPVGGLYGVAIGGAFFAESMFHTETDAGKVAVVHLVNQLRKQGFALCDLQWTTENLCRLGASDVDGETYLDRLNHAVQLGCSFT